MTGLSAADVLLGESASEVLTRLEEKGDARAKAIARRARSLRALLLANCLHGEVVRKPAIPGQLKTRYALENLYVEDLPDYWRLLYTIARRNGKPYVVIVEIVDHRAYTRWFPGKRG